MAIQEKNRSTIKILFMITLSIMGWSAPSQASFFARQFYPEAFNRVRSHMETMRGAVACATQMQAVVRESDQLINECPQPKSMNPAQATLAASVWYGQKIMDVLQPVLESDRSNFLVSPLGRIHPPRSSVQELIAIERVAQQTAHLSPVVLAIREDEIQLQTPVFNFSLGHYLPKKLFKKPPFDKNGIITQDPAVMIKVGEKFTHIMNPVGFFKPQSFLGIAPLPNRQVIFFAQSLKEPVYRSDWGRHRINLLDPTSYKHLQQLDFKSIEILYEPFSYGIQRENALQALGQEATLMRLTLESVRQLLAGYGTLRVDPAIRQEIVKYELHLDEIERFVSGRPYGQWKTTGDNVWP